MFLGVYYHNANDAVKDWKYFQKLIEHSNIYIDGYHLNYTFTASYISITYYKTNGKYKIPRTVIDALDNKLFCIGYYVGTKIFFFETFFVPVTLSIQTKRV